MREAQRAQLEAALYVGWFTERLSRENVLHGPQSYVTDLLDGGASEEVQAEMAEAELSRMAMSWGLEVEDLSEEPESA